MFPSGNNYFCSQTAIKYAFVFKSTVNDIVNKKAKNIGIITIKKLCDGLSISIPEFFDDNIFYELEQEII